MSHMGWAVGLMSGTSLDGIDVALVQTDGVEVERRGAWLTVPFEDSMRHRIHEAVYGKGDVLKLEHDLTLAHAEAVKQLLDSSGMKPKEITVIGFHGQTIIHRPNEGITWQIGNGALLAEKTGIDVVCDFRRRDIAAGGQGAPLIPIYHAALARKFELPVVVLNLGGIANVSWIGRSEETAEDIMAFDIIAFDTGPGNVLLNEWALVNTGRDYDKDGLLALAGVVDEQILADYLKDPYFSLHPPKSLDRNYFSMSSVSHLSVEDGAATLTALTAAAVEKAVPYFPRPVRKWLVHGGGRRNPAIMKELKKRVKDVFPVESVGWEGDALEAQAFAYLAMRSIRRLPLSMPTTTGANRAVTGGAFYPAGRGVSA